MNTNSNPLTLSDFGYNLPENLIAQTPHPNRDGSKLLERKSDGTHLNHLFSELPKILPENSLIIINNSRVFASRLIGHIETGAKVEIFLLEKPSKGEKTKAQALAKPMKKLKLGTKVLFENNVTATVIEKDTRSEGVSPITVEFNTSQEKFLKWANDFGYIPLPPYINRENPKTASASHDAETYQNVFANPLGSVAAPTAGLHFTEAVIKNLKEKNIDIKTVTLHVGAGTFLPVKQNDISKHIMHKEYFNVPEETIKSIQRAKLQGKKVIFVGTTTLRSLESLYLKSKNENKDILDLANRWHGTDLFLRPRYKNEIYSPWGCDALITNFHQPYSTLFMLISNLIGYENAQAHYKKAVSERYRFFSYGDSNLFWLS